jgi:LysR family transcriptional regulator, regulator for bpeEF and oprC
MDKFRALKFFCRAVETKSFTSAAHALDVPPSVVSKVISALEADLRFTLFNRSTRRLSLTEAGARYYDHARQILLDLEEAEAIARSGTVQPTGTLRVGFHPAFRIAVMRKLGEFVTANPGISIEFALTNSPAALLDEGLDVVLRIGELPDSTFVARQLGWTALIACASSAYLQRLGRPRHPRELSAHRAIIPGRRDEESFAHWSFSRGKRREVVAVPVALVAREGIGLVDSAVGGVGIAQIYEIAARPHIDEGRLEAILTDWSCGRKAVYAVIPSRRNVPTKVRVFLDFVASLIP